MAGLSEHQAAFTAARAEREAARARLRANSTAVDATEAELESLRRQLAGNPDLASRIGALERALANRRHARDQAKARLGGFDAKLGEMIGDAVFADPARLVEQLDDRTPFLLLPVRLETRFWTEGEQHELRVRIFPDTIAVTAHEEALTAGEVDAARGFWRRRAAAARLGDDERDGSPRRPRGPRSSIATARGVPPISCAASGRPIGTAIRSRHPRR
jgi:hypothetical protein